MDYNQSKAPAHQSGWAYDNYGPPGVDQYSGQTYGMHGSSMGPPGTANTSGSWNAAPQYWPTNHYDTYQQSYGSYGSQPIPQPTPLHIPTAPLPYADKWQQPLPPTPLPAPKQSTQSSQSTNRGSDFPARNAQASSAAAKPTSGAQASSGAPKPATRPLSSSATTITNIAGIPHVIKNASSSNTGDRGSEDGEVTWFEDRGKRREMSTADGKGGKERQAATNGSLSKSDTRGRRNSLDSVAGSNDSVATRRRRSHAEDEEGVRGSRYRSRSGSRDRYGRHRRSPSPRRRRSPSPPVRERLHSKDTDRHRVRSRERVRDRSRDRRRSWSRQRDRSSSRSRDRRARSRSKDRRISTTSARAESGRTQNGKKDGRDAAGGSAQGPMSSVDIRRTSNNTGSKALETNGQANTAAASASSGSERNRDNVVIEPSPFDWLQTKAENWPVEALDGEDHTVYDASMRRVVSQLANNSPPIRVNIQPIYEQRINVKNMILTERDTDNRKRFVVQLPVAMLMPWVTLIARNPKNKKLGLSIFQMPKKARDYTMKDHRLIQYAAPHNMPSMPSIRDFLVICNGQYLKLGEPKAFDFAFDILPAVESAKREGKDMLVFQIVTCSSEYKQGFCAIGYMREGDSYDEVPVFDPDAIFSDPAVSHISEADQETVNARARQLHQGQMNAQNTIQTHLDSMKLRQKALDMQAARVSQQQKELEKEQKRLQAQAGQPQPLQHQQQQQAQQNQNKGKQPAAGSQPAPRPANQQVITPRNPYDNPPAHFTKKQKKDWKKQQEEMLRAQNGQSVGGSSNNAGPSGQNQQNQPKKRAAPPAPEFSNKRGKGNHGGPTGANTVPQTTNNNHRRLAATTSSAATGSAIQTPIDSEDDDFEIGEEIVSLKCPLTLTRINDPIKGFDCAHLQCFDRENYNALNANKAKWKCPVCDKYLGPGPHATNLLFAQLLAQYPEATRVLVKKNGTHEAYNEESSKKNKKGAGGGNQQEGSADLSSGSGGGGSGGGGSGGGGSSKVVQEEIIVLSDDD